MRLAPQPVVDRLHGADDLRIVRRKHAEVPESVDAGVDRLIARHGAIGANVDPAQEAVRLRVEEEASRPLLDALRHPAVAVGQRRLAVERRKVGGRLQPRPDGGHREAHHAAALLPQVVAGLW